MKKYTNYVSHLGKIILVALFVMVLSSEPVKPVSAEAGCFSLPDLNTHELSEVINTYFPGTASVSVGATSLTLGAGRGANIDIANGDLLLVIQMQSADINNTNTAAYGSGGTTGSGYTNANNVGLYEYVVASNSVSFATGGTLPITSGLEYAYTNANATATTVQRRFQVIRVPAYLNVNLDSASDLTAAAWNGTTGGVLALEVVNNLNFNGADIDVSGLGFRGGAGRQLSGATGYANTDYRTPATASVNGAKGEGISGTPIWVLDNLTVIDTNPSNGVGYPDGTGDGSQARGAPGNGGGGGTDGQPSDGYPDSNKENSGGGGGGNRGSGGLGGLSWRSEEDVGGRGGAALAVIGDGRVVLGGGGGAGTSNNGTGGEIGACSGATNDATGAGICSSGGAGGGIVFLRAGNVINPGVISANGNDSYEVAIDSTGGGGAGGSILVITDDTSLSGLTVNANGGNAGNANPEDSTLALPEVDYLDERHGPGGGGGGGVIFLTQDTSVTINFAGGSNGTTTSLLYDYGATDGQNGTSATTESTLPGAPPGFDCFTPTSVELSRLQVQPGNNDQWLLGVLLSATISVLGIIWLRHRHKI